ncbi:hypothetical protein GCM10022406_24160 [Hymenobacter algoricola]|uniref:Uncharacterized protein n=2 Tax=Hymenobacter algoricola TaxID=486267 RepID=A0ABP7N833_9BACT
MPPSRLALGLLAPALAGLTYWQTRPRRRAGPGQNVGAIVFDPGPDRADFNLCQEQRIFEYYPGLTYRQLHDATSARISFRQARTLYQQGYGRHDPCVEVLDQVYLPDIEAALKE